MGVASSKTDNHKHITHAPSRASIQQGRALQNEAWLLHEKQAEAHRREQIVRQQRYNQRPDVERGVMTARHQEAPLLALSKTTGFSLILLRRLHVLFRLISSCQIVDDVIDASELSQALGIPQDNFLFFTLFCLFDITRSNNVNFPTWVLTLSALSPQATLEQKIRFSFHILDVNGDGFIEQNELINLMTSAINLLQSQPPLEDDISYNDYLERASSISLSLSSHNSNISEDSQIFNQISPKKIPSSVITNNSHTTTATTTTTTTNQIKKTSALSTSQSTTLKTVIPISLQLSSVVKHDNIINENVSPSLTSSSTSISSQFTVISSNNHSHDHSHDISLSRTLQNNNNNNNNNNFDKNKQKDKDSMFMPFPDIELNEDDIRGLVKRTLDEADVNGDGRVSFEEYFNMMKNSHIFMSMFTIDIDTLCALLTSPEVQQAVIMDDSTAKKRALQFHNKNYHHVIADSYSTLVLRRKNNMITPKIQSTSSLSLIKTPDFPNQQKQQKTAKLLKSPNHQNNILANINNNDATNLLHITCISTSNSHSFSSRSRSLSASSSSSSSPSSSPSPPLSPSLSRSRSPSRSQSNSPQLLTTMLDKDDVEKKTFLQHKNTVVSPTHLINDKIINTNNTNTSLQYTKPNFLATRQHSLPQLLTTKPKDKSITCDQDSDEQWTQVQLSETSDGGLSMKSWQNSILNTLTHKQQPLHQSPSLVLSQHQQQQQHQQQYDIHNDIHEKHEEEKPQILKQQIITGNPADIVQLSRMIGSTPAIRHRLSLYSNSNNSTSTDNDNNSDTRSFAEDEWCLVLSSSISSQSSSHHQQQQQQQSQQYLSSKNNNNNNNNNNNSNNYDIHKYSQSHSQTNEQTSIPFEQFTREHTNINKKPQLIQKQHSHSLLFQSSTQQQQTSSIPPVLTRTKSTLSGFHPTMLSNQKSPSFNEPQPQPQIFIQQGGNNSNNIDLTTQQVNFAATLSPITETKNNSNKTISTTITTTTSISSTIQQPREGCFNISTLPKIDDFLHNNNHNLDNNDIAISTVKPSTSSQLQQHRHQQQQQDIFTLDEDENDDTIGPIHSQVTKDGHILSSSLLEFLRNHPEAYGIDLTPPFDYNIMCYDDDTFCEVITVQNYDDLGVEEPDAIQSIAMEQSAPALQKLIQAMRGEVDWSG